MAKEEEKKKENRHSAEGRKRPALSALFFGDGQNKHKEEPRATKPILTLEVASPERHPDQAATILEVSSVSSVETPVKKARPRPMSEQLLNRPRPEGFVGDSGEGNSFSMTLHSC